MPSCRANDQPGAPLSPALTASAATGGECEYEKCRNELNGGPPCPPDKCFWDATSDKRGKCPVHDKVKARPAAAARKSPKRRPAARKRSKPARKAAPARRRGKGKSKRR